MNSTGMDSSSNLSEDGTLTVASEQSKEEVTTWFSSSQISIPYLLKRVVVVEEAGIDTDDLTILVIAVHGLFLESGFVATGRTKGSYRLPEGFASNTSPVMLLSYVTPQMRGLSDEVTVSVKVLCTGKFANVYAYLPESSDVRRICLDVSSFGPSLSSSMFESNEETKSRILELRKMVKDQLCLPLLMEISDKHDLPPPPCFTILPTDIKLMIMETLPGLCLGRVACVSSEMRGLSSIDELWGKKFVEEFGVTDAKGLSGRLWKDKFVILWEKRKQITKRRRERGRWFHELFNGSPRRAS